MQEMPSSGSKKRKLSLRNEFLLRHIIPDIDFRYISIEKEELKTEERPYYIRSFVPRVIQEDRDVLRYQQKREESMQDFSDRVPGKFVHVFPESLLGGILGFTYLGENFMGKREDMIGNEMVDVHESIHTDNEYETRLLTSWILSREKPMYVK